MKLKPCDINTQNTSFDKDVDFDGKIYCFYHIYCGPNDWCGIVDEQVRIMKLSGLFPRVDKFYITIIGNESDRSKIENIFRDKKYEIIRFSPDGSCYEFPSLEAMTTIAQKESFYALYLHTKGASYTREGFQHESSSFDWKQLQLTNWRMLMNYFNLYKWNMAVNVLKAGYDTYGILSRTKPKKHFSGNFWWAKSEAILRSPVIDTQYKKSRYNAEFWINEVNTKQTIERGSKLIYSPFKRGLLLSIKWHKNSLKLLPWYHPRNILYLINGRILSK